MPYPGPGSIHNTVMTSLEQIDAEIEERLFELRSALVDLADLSTRLRIEIDERGSAARLPETATVSTQGAQVDRLLAIVHCLRNVRQRLG